MKTGEKNSGFTPLEKMAMRIPIRSNRRLLTGFTLIEIMVVVAVLVILVSMMVGIAKRIDDQGKERLCRDTIALIGNALEQFRDFGYEYKDAFYSGLTFPLDCNGFTSVDIEPVLSIALYAPAAGVDIFPDDPVHDPNYSGSEVLYFILSQVPDCRATLDKIDKSLLTNNTQNGTSITITITSTGTPQTFPFTRFIDPWGTTLRYDYYPDIGDYTGLPSQYQNYRDSAKKTFPVITSAGPDKRFDTLDDISNIQKK